MNRAPFEKMDLYIRYESGWDNSVRWDLPCSDYCPNDLNCYAVMMYCGMALIAALQGKETDAEVYRLREKLLCENINRYLWNVFCCERPEGLYNKKFSWSAVFVIEFILSF